MPHETETPIDTKRVAHAARLYNDALAALKAAGWWEVMEEPTPWHPEGVPTGTWRHADEGGTFSMSAAFVRHAGNRRLDETAAMFERAKHKP